jgi:hypothetical protein
MLVRVVRDVSPAAKGIRRPFAPRIETLPPPLLRERLAANARWVTVRETEHGWIEIPARPPTWCVGAVHARGEWQGIRHLEAVVDYPVLRPDGSILSRPGYDAETRLLLESVGTFPGIPDHPTRADAVAARDLLTEVVADFPFERPIHSAAWFAALLTPLARFAFTGPAPLFLVDANVRAAGKGLLLDTISRIATGERFTIATYTRDEDELRKRITSLVLAGDRLVLFDNLDGKFGGAVLDAALTGTAWKDRVLGANRMAEAPMYMTWYATGNNVAIAADTARRVCHVRLESPEERPEERQGFRHPNLLAWVGDNRGKLLAAALTILRAYCVADRPVLELPAWGSFEGWSALVRSAVVWVGLPDPGETRLLLQAQADVAAESMAIILAAWELLDPQRRGLTSAELIHTVYKAAPEPLPAHYADMRDGLEALLGKPDTLVWERGCGPTAAGFFRAALLTRQEAISGPCAGRCTPRRSFGTGRNTLTTLTTLIPPGANHRASWVSVVSVVSVFPATTQATFRRGETSRSAGHRRAPGDETRADPFGADRCTWSATMPLCRRRTTAVARSPASLLAPSYGSAPALPYRSPPSYPPREFWLKTLRIRLMSPPKRGSVSIRVNGF